MQFENQLPQHVVELLWVDFIAVRPRQQLREPQLHHMQCLIHCLRVVLDLLLHIDHFILN